MTDEQTGTLYLVEAEQPDGSYVKVGEITAPHQAKKPTVFRSAVAHSDELQCLAKEWEDVTVRLIPAGEVYSDTIGMKRPPQPDPVMHIGGKPAEDYRSAITGRFVSADDAAKNEDTTVHESRDAA